MRTSSGLGNQLFQLANGLEQARRLDTSVVCDRTGNDGKSDRSYALGLLEQEGVIESIINTSETPFSDSLVAFSEKTEFRFDKSIMKISTGTCLSGYFQHPMYSTNSIGEILSSLTQFRTNESESNTIHVHVRRGDLSTNSYLRRKLGLLDIRYYVKAIVHLEEHGINVRKIRVFSDSPSEAISLFRTVFYNKDVVLGEAHQDPIKSLVGLAGTSTLVGANSTFSWWAAKLAESINPEARIIFPQGMLRSFPESKVLLPDNWSLIKPTWV